MGIFNVYDILIDNPASLSINIDTYISKTLLINFDLKKI